MFVQGNLRKRVICGNRRKFRSWIFVEHKTREKVGRPKIKKKEVKRRRKRIGFSRSPGSMQSSSESYERLHCLKRRSNAIRKKEKERGRA